MVGRPVKQLDGYGEEEEQVPYTAKEAVLRFASASLYAERMERLAEEYRRDGGCSCDREDCPYPDCTAYDDHNSADRYCDRFFIRMKVSGKLLWQGSSMCSNGDIYLGDREKDLSEEFDWPAMAQFSTKWTRQPPSCLIFACRKFTCEGNQLEHSFRPAKMTSAFERLPGRLLIHSH